MLEEAAAALVRLGITEYEAKVYAALVGLGEGTVRQVHEASKVPRSRVYDVLETLVSKGFVEERHGNPMCYRAVEPHRIIAKLRTDFEATSKDAISNLERLNIDAVRSVSPIWYVRGDWSIQSRLEEMIARTSKELMIFAAKSQYLKDIAPRIEELSRNATVTCVVRDGGRYFADKLGKTVLMEPAPKGDALIEEAFQTKVFKGKIETGGAQYRAECLLLRDGKESMLVYEVDGQRMAFMVELPIITHIQREFFNEVVGLSKKISKGTVQERP
jgi:sugar-specific transcriptional regulator TrmB